MIAAVTPTLPRDLDSVPRLPYPHYTSSAGSLADAIKEGMAEAYPADEILTIDAGGHDPLEHRRFFCAPEADLVIGSRFVDGGSHSGPRWRQVGSRVYGWLCSLVTMCPVKDWTSGYRLYRNDAIDVALATPGEGHAWQAAVVGECHRRGLKIVEVPIHYEASTSSLSLGRAFEAVRVWCWLWR